MGLTVHGPKPSLVLGTASNKEHPSAEKYRKKYSKWKWDHAERRESIIDAVDMEYVS